MRMEKYIGETIEIIYFDCDNRITQRRIEVRAVNSGIVKAYCFERKAPRLFHIDNILAVQPLIRHAVWYWTKGTANHRQLLRRPQTDANY